MEHLAITCGHLLQHFMNIIMVNQRIHVHVLIFAILHSQQYLALLVMTTFVTLAVRIKPKTSSTETILSGMVLDVVHSVHVVPGTLHHGSGKRSLLPPVMTLR